MVHCATGTHRLTHLSKVLGQGDVIINRVLQGNSLHRSGQAMRRNTWQDELSLHGGGAMKQTSIPFGILARQAQLNQIPHTCLHNLIQSWCCIYDLLVVPRNMLVSTPGAGPQPQQEWKGATEPAGQVT